MSGEKSWVQVLEWEDWEVTEESIRVPATCLKWGRGHPQKIRSTAIVLDIGERSPMCLM
jgi:hypothetical protein